MTAPMSIEDLSAFEFEIQCEGEKCENPAVVMCKACGDKRHYAICGRHLQQARDWFENKGAVVCSICHRPWLHFETHYSVQDI